MELDSYTNQSWIKEILFFSSGVAFDSPFLPTVTTDVTTKFFEISKCVLRVFRCCFLCVAYILYQQSSDLIG